MGWKQFTGNGAILADEMGLGKTLQAITIIWTLLKQNPFFFTDGSVAKRALVLCPATLVKNWTNEFKKWLGDERLKVFAVDQHSNIADFCKFMIGIRDAVLFYNLLITLSSQL